MTSTEITTAQIKQLRDEALAAGDYAQVDVCERALATETVDQDGHAIALADWTQDEARAECARVIRAAASQD